MIEFVFLHLLPGRVSRATAVLLPVLAALPTAAAEIALRSAPAADAPVLARLPADAPALRDAAPVIGTGADAGDWRWTEHNVTFRGHVRERALGKDLRVGAGIPIRSAPRPDAPVLARTGAGDRFDVVRAENGWAAVRGSKTLPLYFRPGGEAGRDTARTEDPGRQTMSPPKTQKPGPATPRGKRPPPRARDRVRFDPDESVGNTRPEALPAENVEWRAPGDTRAAETDPASARGRRSASDGIIVETPADTARARPQKPAPKPGTPIRILTGKLIRKITSRGPRYPLRLRGEDGRIAYIDMSRLYISDLRPYLDREVRIRGELRPLATGGNELVLHARTIRLVD